MRTICASSVSAPTRSARMTKVPVPLIVPPRDMAARYLLDGDRLARDHRLVHGALPIEHDAIDGHPLAGPHAQAITDLHVTERHVLFPAIVRQAPGRLGLKAQQRPDRPGRRAPGAQLEHLAEEHQRGDDRR